MLTNTNLSLALYNMENIVKSDKIERLLSRTLPRTVRVSFKTYGSNRPLSEFIRC